MNEKMNNGTERKQEDIALLYLPRRQGPNRRSLMKPVAMASTAQPSPPNRASKGAGNPTNSLGKTELLIRRILEEVKYDYHTHYLSSKEATRHERLYPQQSHDVHYSYLGHVSTLKRAVPVSRSALVSWKMGTGTLVVPRRRRDVESYGLKIWVGDDWAEGKPLAPGAD